MSYYLSILAIVKNESLTIGEWIEHHIWQGVDHFFLIDAGSTDATHSVLEKFGDRLTLETRLGQFNQVEFLSYLYQKNRNLSHWFSICDVDEFWYGKRQELAEVLKKSEEFSCIFTNWRHFGSMGFSRQPDSVRLRLIRCGDLESSTFDGKCIFASKDTSAVNVHCVTSAGRSLRDNIRLGLNHYRIQSDERFEKKRATEIESRPVVTKGRPFNWFVKGWDDYRERFDQNQNTDTALRDLVLKGYPDLPCLRV